ncbi:MAG: hypothetical protein SFT68_04760 [Rickettsiaceae bacterium]|nr:hypothetical protein [Rickettsiaceae bacterium]
MFQIKSEVQDLNFEYKQLSKQYSDEKKQLNILKAELTYLKSPKRLQTLASMYLNLDNIKPNQLVNNKNEVGLIAKSNFMSASAKLKGKKWRYKKSSSSVHNASIASKK